MLGRLLGIHPHTEERGYSLSQLAGLIGTGYSFGYTPVPVSLQRTLGHSASSACIDVLASSVGVLPLGAVRHRGKIRQPIVPTPPLLATPSSLVDIDVWLYQVVESMCTDGNAFGLVVDTDEMARPRQIELVEPSGVNQREVVDGIPQAHVDNKLHRLYPWGDLWHVPGKFVRAGTPFAESPIERAAATIGAGIAARDYGSRFFADGGHPAGILYSDNAELTPDQAKAIKRSWVDATRGSREPAVMGAGLKYESVSVDPQDTQYLDLMRFVIEEACRFWRVPPSMVYAAISGQNITYSNASQADLHYLKHSLDPYLVRLERALSRLIAGPQVVRFNRNALLRTDAEGRNKVYDIRLRNRSLTVNEVRAFEDEEPFSDAEFDEPGIPGGPTDPPAGPPEGGAA